MNKLASPLFIELRNESKIYAGLKIEQVDLVNKINTTKTRISSLAALLLSYGVKREQIEEIINPLELHI